MGDIGTVHLPSNNVLVVGDVLAVGSYPVVDDATGGWIGGLEHATKTLPTCPMPRRSLFPRLDPRRLGRTYKPNSTVHRGARKGRGSNSEKV